MRDDDDFNDAVFDLRDAVAALWNADSYSSREDNALRDVLALSDKLRDLTRESGKDHEEAGESPAVESSSERQSGAAQAAPNADGVDGGAHPPSAVGKFKVGDRVRVIAYDGFFRDVAVGDVGVVIEVDDDECPYKLDLYGAWFEPQELELVEEKRDLVVEAWFTAEELKKVYKTEDNVNHPSHYRSHPSGVECIDIAEHFGYNLGNAVKYIWRADLKNDAEEDLRKAAWYINRELERRTKEKQ